MALHACRVWACSDKMRCPVGHGYVCRYDLPEAEVAAAVAAALKLVNMEDFMYRATHTLSGGQRQRVAIAGAEPRPLEGGGGVVVGG